MNHSLITNPGNYQSIHPKYQTSISLQAPLYSVGETNSSKPDRMGRVSRSLTLLFQLDRKLSKGSIVQLRCEAALPGVPLPPQETTQEVHVRDPNDPQFSNQQQWWVSNGIYLIALYCIAVEQRATLWQFIRENPILRVESFIIRRNGGLGGDSLFAL